MREEPSRAQLIRILRNAYSGELAAAYAYRGHWKALADEGEGASVRRIEAEEWSHRKNVGRMLRELDSRPLTRGEIKMWVIGRTVGLACHLMGWFLPMYFAGRLETMNVEEYQVAARCAEDLGLLRFKDELL